jgi:hypothetical protein
MAFNNMALFQISQLFCSANGEFLKNGLDFAGRDTAVNKMTSDKV